MQNIIFRLRKHFRHMKNDGKKFGTKSFRLLEINNVLETLL